MSVPGKKVSAIFVAEAVLLPIFSEEAAKVMISYSIKRMIS